MNYFKTFLLLFSLTCLFMLIGYAIGGVNGAIISLLLAGGINMFAFWNSDKLVLKMTKAEIADVNEYKEFYSIVNNLVSVANMPMPKLYVMHQDAPNAFATGRNPQNSAVAITTGIWHLLSKEELAGVIAHELAHIQNRDTLISTIAATFAGAISMLANMFMFMNLFGGHGGNRPHPVVGILVMLIAPIVAAIIQMAVSRSREYAADKLGGRMCGNPLYLASALRKLEDYGKGISNRVSHQNEEQKANPATAHLFIVSPFGRTSQQSDALFSTHPNTHNRIAALERQANNMGITSYSFNRNSFNRDDRSRISTRGVERMPLPSRYTDENVKNNPWI